MKNTTLRTLKVGDVTAASKTLQTNGRDRKNQSKRNE